MRDWLPEESFYWQTIEQELKSIFTEYGYLELRTPIIEETRLFTRSLGEVTDIVEKEMYTFSDQNDELSLTLRPEMTAGIVRAGVEHGLFHNQIQKVWQIGPAFRYERPQKGRYRQFHQADVEVFGIETPDIDAEILAMLARLWKRLGIDHVLTLELNSMGVPESRKIYRQALIEYFEMHKELLDEESQRRLYSNPLRILDSKNPQMAEMIADAPALIDYLDAESKSHFDRVCTQLDQLKIPYIVNPRIVRGMDYYTRTVFEWTTDQLGAQGTVCGGGRYDGMVEELGGRATPALGFGIGMERLLLLCKACDVPEKYTPPLLTTVFLGEDAMLYGLTLIEALRDALPGCKIITNLGGGSMRSQMRRADRSNARYALIIGEEELKAQTIVVRDLRQDGEQITLTEEQLLKGCEQGIDSLFDKKVKG